MFPTLCWYQLKLVSLRTPMTPWDEVIGVTNQYELELLIEDATRLGYIGSEVRIAFRPESSFALWYIDFTLSLPTRRRVSLKRLLDITFPITVIIERENTELDALFYD